MHNLVLAAVIGTASAQLSGKGGIGFARPQPSSSAPVYSCPDGYSLAGKTCQRSIEAIPSVICAQGSLRGDVCLIETAKQTRCPPGTTAQGKQCVLSIQQPAFKQCPFGYNDTGFGCESTEQLPLIEVCEIGSREGPQCATVETAQYLVNQFCPPGFEEMAKGGCWKMTTYDCTPLSHGKGGMALRGMIGKDSGMQLPVNPKVNVIQQTCERKEPAAYITEKQCPGDFTDTGAGCILKNFHPTTTRCSNGGPLESCYTTRNAPFAYECPPGSTMSGQTCTSVQTQAPESFCATGFDNGMLCQEQFLPQMSCPIGLQLSGNICVGLETAPPQVTVTVTCVGKDCHNH